MTSAWQHRPDLDAAAIDRLSDRQIAEWAPAFTPRWNTYIPHTPTAKQWAFLLAPEREVLFGGQAGGGKSDALLMAALQYVDVPGYSALLIRRTYADLEKPGALLPRSHEWLSATDAHWNGRRWIFPSGAYLDFGYLDKDNDKLAYQSSEYQFLGFDELTQLSESTYRYLFSRARRTTRLADVPVRVRAASNPGGPGNDWVRQRFLVEGGQAGRRFIPARLEDNPYLDQEEYEYAMSMLDPVTYAQLRHGDWSVKQPGAFFSRSWFEIVEAVPAGARWVRSWDFAATKSQSSAYTAGALAALHDGVLYIADMVRIKGDPGEVEAVVRQTAERDGRAVTIWIEQEPGSGGVNTLFRYQRSVLVGFAVRAFQPKHDKLTRAAPLSAMARAGNVKLVAGRWIGPFLDEAVAFPDGWRDQVDATSAAQTVLTQAPVPNIRRI